MGEDELARRRAERDEEEQEWIEERQRRLREMRIRSAALPRKWKEQAFGDLEDDPARERARALAVEWAVGARQGLVLWGPVGRGKTALAAAAANRRLDFGPVRWLSVAELLKDLRMPFDSQEYVRAQRALDAGKAALVLDDLDKGGKASEHSVHPIYVAVNGWIEAELPLLVTVNRDLDELADWFPDTFGEAIASRLSGYCATVEVAGRDRRLPV